MPTYQKVPDGKRFHPSYGHIVEHQGYSTRIFWSKAKRIEGLKRWCRLHPDKVSERSRKIWETRRKKKMDNEQETADYQQ